MGWERGSGHTQVVSGHDDAVLELYGYYRSAGDDGRLCVLVGTVGLHIRAVVGAVDVVSGLLERNRKALLSACLLWIGRWRWDMKTHMDMEMDISPG